MIFPRSPWSFRPSKRDALDPSHPIPGEGRGGAGPFNGPQVFMRHMGFDEEDEKDDKTTNKPENSAREKVERCRNYERKF
jgi:hypothetical protein